MNEQVIVVVESEEEKEYGQILKDILNDSNVFETALWTTKDYTDNEATLPSSQKFIFIGENEVSKRNFNTVEWKFEKLHMKYGWIGSRALLMVDNIFFTKEESEEFNQLRGITNINFTWSGDTRTKPVVLPWQQNRFSLINLLIKSKKLTDREKNELKQALLAQKKKQYHYLINYFVMKEVNPFLEGYENFQKSSSGES